MSHNIDFKTIKQKILKFTWELTNSMKQKKRWYYKTCYIVIGLK